MGLIQRLFGTEKRAADEETGTFSETNSALLKALVGSSEVTAETALEIPAFSAAVDFISTTIAMLPVKLYRENAEQRKTEEVTDDRRLFLLNDEADNLMNAFEAKRAQVRDMLIGGAGYVYINRNGGAVSSLHYVKQGDVSVMKNSDPIFREADILVGARHYYPFDFVILTRNSVDGVTGVGAVKEHNALLSAMYNLIKYENSVSKTGGNKKGFLQANHKLAKPAVDELKQAWSELYSNSENNMMILNDGVTYAPSAASAVEMQLNENKESNSAQIASIFGLSVDVISGRAGTQEYMSAVRTAILPIVEAYQAALNRALLAESEKGQMYFALDTTELLKGDTLSRYQAYAVGLQNNFLQIDEVRYMEDREPIGFDYVKLGLQDVLLDPKTGTIYTPNTNQLTKMGQQLLQNPVENGITGDGEERSADDYVVAVDFDGTLCDSHYPYCGKPIAQTVERVRELKKNGATIILWTCRAGKALQAAVDWCKEQGVPVDYVNENTPDRIKKFGSDSRKISADLYIDDKSGRMLLQNPSDSGIIEERGH